MSQIYSYRSDQQEANQGTLTKQGLDGPSYIIDFTDGIGSGVTVSSVATTAVDANNVTVTSNCILSSSASGALATIRMLTCGAGGTGAAPDGAQFRLRTSLTLSVGSPLVYDVFVLVENDVYSPGSGGSGGGGGGGSNNVLELLAEPDGSSLVGFLQEGTGAVATTVESVLREWVSVFEFLTASQQVDVRNRNLSFDATSAINAAVTAARGVLSGGQYIANKKVVLPNGAYQLTSRLNLYASNGAYSGLWIAGESKRAASLVWTGSSSESIIKMIGTFQKISDLQIENRTGCLDAIQYDGDPSVGISTGGLLSNIWLDGNGQQGNGITLGRSAYQADQLHIDHPYINSFSSGRAIQTLDSNALSCVVTAPSINHCWIGVQMNNSTNIQIDGPEFDNNDVNVMGGSGSIQNISGGRTEGSKHSFWSSAGTYPQTTSWTGHIVSSDYASENPLQPRPAATCTSTDSLHITLSNASFAPGDYVVIAGAGTAGANLHTHIAAMADPLHAALDQVAIVTPVTNAAITYDTSVEQNAFVEQGGGPYIHSAVYFNITGGSVFPTAIGPQVWTGCGFAQNIPNPLNVADIDRPASASWTGCYKNAVPTSRMTNWISL